MTGDCAVCKVQMVRMPGEVMGAFEGIDMCHTHLLDAREGKMAESLLREVKLSIKPIPPASKTVAEKTEPTKRDPNEKAMQIIVRLKSGDDRRVIANDLQISKSYIAKVKREFLPGVALPAMRRCERMSDRAQKIRQMMEFGLRVTDIARELKLSHSYISRLKRRFEVQESMR